jgi:hypothetical protein
MITSKGADVERLLIPGQVYVQGDVHQRNDLFKATKPPVAPPPGAAPSLRLRL